MNEDVVARLAELRRRAGLEHTHSRRTLLTIVVAVTVLGLYAGWLTADFGLRVPAFAVVGLASAYWLYGQAHRAAVVVRALYALAAMVLLTPVFLNLPFLLAAGRYDVADPTAFGPRLADVILLIAFGVLAAIPAGAGFLIRRRAGSGSDS